MNYYVSAKVIFSGDGTTARPFKTIQEAANVAKPGDEVIVLPGVYRESVNPINSGLKEKPITYQSKEIGKAIITGSEIVDYWILESDNVWFAKIPNVLFKEYNPYLTQIKGDWYNGTKKLHTGEVYLNGKSMYEVETLEEVFNPKIDDLSLEKEFSIYKWHTFQENEFTVIYANFNGSNPNKEFVEINVRRTCFHPNKTGVNYINVFGFVIKQAATTWAPPTAFQEGAIGPHWSKGWRIEDCEVSDSKCVGISLGKYLQPNNENKWTTKNLKHGTQTERDAICQAQVEGWNKENIGSHIIRRCKIYNCEQAGIVGHLGCVFSLIEDNHIHSINNKQQLQGAEIAAIKLHAAIDTIIRRNHIHNSTRGIWLDWQAQGTRITQNLLHDNYNKNAYPLFSGEDIFVEVSHGPTLIDNNILLSAQAARISAQGIAFVHNLINGSLTSVGDGTDNFGLAEIIGTSSKYTGHTVRYTPYHFPHETYIAGFMTFLHGDVKFYNNIFVQNSKAEYYKEKFTKIVGEKQMERINLDAGTFPYDEYPTESEYLAKFADENDKGRDKYYEHLPVSYGGNVYYNGAKPSKKETDFYVDETNKIEIKLVKEENKYSLITNIHEYLINLKAKLVSTDLLGEAFEPEQKYENPDGSSIIFEYDYFGVKRSNNPLVGPIESINNWKKILN